MLYYKSISIFILYCAREKAMKKSEIKLFRLWDIAVFAAILILALVLLLLGLKKDGDAVLVISVDGKETEYSLNESRDIVIESEGVTLTVTVKEGAVWVSKTDCRNALCSHSGKIDKAGQIIVCAPARVSLKINGKGGELDAITG